MRLREDFWSKLDFLNELIDLPPSPVNPLRYFKFSNAHIQQICTVFLYADLEHIHSFTPHPADMHRAKLFENLHPTVHFANEYLCTFCIFGKGAVSSCIGGKGTKFHSA